MSLRGEPDETAFYRTQLKRFSAILIVAFLAVLFIFWRVENERAERLRMMLVEVITPGLELRHLPGRALHRMSESVTGFVSARRQQEALEEDIRSLEFLRQRVTQLEYENFQLRRLINYRSPPQNSTMAARILVDTRTRVGRSILIGIGREQGAMEGWPILGGIGLLGRIVVTGEDVSRVILISDVSSKVPAKLYGSATVGMVVGDNSATPRFEAFSGTGSIAPGQQVFTSGNGGVFPPGLLIGTLVRLADGSMHILPSENLDNLDYVQVLDSRMLEDFGNSVPLVIAP